MTHHLMSRGKNKLHSMSVGVTGTGPWLPFTGWSLPLPWRPEPTSGSRR